MIGNKYNRRNNRLVDFTISQLIGANVFLGHRASRVDPRIFEMLAGVRNGVYLIDLTWTIRALRSALVSMSYVVQRRGRVMLVNMEAVFFSQINNYFRLFCLRYFF